MEIATATFGLLLGLTGLSALAWKAWKLFDRGRKDWLWIWQEANRSAAFLWIFASFMMAAEMLRDGISLKFWIYLGLGIVGTGLVYLTYAFGRFFGLWQRSKNPDLSR